MSRHAVVAEALVERRAAPGPRVAFASASTGIEVPPKRPDAVRRERLIELVGSSDAPIVTIVAPAGYGKTTLLAQLARAEHRAVVWVTLRRRDTDPAVLVRHLLAAFGATGGPKSPQRPVTDAPAQASPSTSRLDRVIARLSPFALYLDDVDAVTGSASSAVILDLVERLPSGSRVTMASRSEPPVALARQRALGTLLELDRARLAFDDAEAIAFAHGFGDGQVTESVRALGQRAEGWITGMVLGVMATQADDAGVDIESIDGDDRFIADYLEAEVLQGLTDEERTLLRRTAFLDRLSGPLCDAILGRSGSSAMLESMERANRFLVPLDHRREWYRHHRSLRAMLRAELDREESGALPALARRAAVWLGSHQQAGDALEAARLAGNMQLMASLLLAHARRLLESGELDRLIRWLEWFEDSGALEHHPAATLSGSWLLLHSGNGRWARRWLSGIAGDASGRPGVGPTDASAPPAALIRAALADGGATRMLADARIACEQVPEHSPWRAEALCLLGVALGLTLAPDESAAALDGAIEASGEAAAVTRAIAFASRGFEALRRGDRRAAAADSTAARESLTHAHVPEVTAWLLVDALAARVALMRGDRHRAEGVIAHARGLRREVRPGLPWLVAQADIELARASLGLGDIAGARSLLREVDAMFRWIPPLGRLVDDAREVAHEAAALTLGTLGTTALTAAEQRLLPYLSTHLSFPEIAERLVLSQNTIKSQVMAIYRKLDATSRTTAVDRARSLGLVEGDTDLATRRPDPSDPDIDPDARLIATLSA